MRRHGAAAVVVQDDDGRATRAHPAVAKSLRLELLRPTRESGDFEGPDLSLTQDQLEIMK